MPAKRKATGAERAKPKHHKPTDEPAPEKSAEVPAVAEKQKDEPAPVKSEEVTDVKIASVRSYFSAVVLITNANDPSWSGWGNCRRSLVHLPDCNRSDIRDQMCELIESGYIVKDGHVLQLTVICLNDHGEVDPSNTSVKSDTVFEVTAVKWKLKSDSGSVGTRTEKTTARIVGPHPHYHGTEEFYADVKKAIPEDYVVITRIKAKPAYPFNDALAAASPV